MSFHIEFNSMTWPVYYSAMESQNIPATPQLVDSDEDGSQLKLVMSSETDNSGGEVGCNVEIAAEVQEGMDGISAGELEKIMSIIKHMDRATMDNLLKVGKTTQSKRTDQAHADGPTEDVLIPACTEKKKSKSPSPSPPKESTDRKSGLCIMEISISRNN